MTLLSFKSGISFFFLSFLDNLFCIDLLIFSRLHVFFLKNNWIVSPSSGCDWEMQWQDINHEGGLDIKQMSIQTGSSRGHHLANYHRWDTVSDLNCHCTHITPCPRCPAICHWVTRPRRTVWGHRDRRQVLDNATWPIFKTEQAEAVVVMRIMSDWPPACCL